MIKKTHRQETADQPIFQIVWSPKIGEQCIKRALLICTCLQFKADSLHFSLIDSFQIQCVGGQYQNNKNGVTVQILTDFVVYTTTTATINNNIVMSHEVLFWAPLRCDRISD